MADLKRIAEDTVKRVISLGASECDVLGADSRFISAEIEKSSMKQSNMVADPGVAIRAFKNGCAGFAFCTGHNVSAIRKAASLAVSEAASGTPDPDFKGLPERKRPPKVGGLFQKRIDNLEPDDIVEMAISLSDIAGDDRRITSVNSGVTIGRGEFALANSNGFSSSQKMTTFEVTTEAVARDGDRMSSGIDAAWSRKLDERLLGIVGESARKHAVQGLVQTTQATGDFPVVLDPLAAATILGAAIGGGVNAESVQRKRSYLEGKLGTVIGSKNLTVLDDPTIEWANGSYSFDGEGAAAQRKTVVDKGRLKTYLYDSYTAGKESKKSTGNASRGGSVWSFRGPPTISPSNLVIKNGDWGTDEMISETRKGVYLRITYDNPNLATGEFSGLMMESFKIDHGELGPSIRQSTIGISLLDLFSRVDMVGKNSRDVFGVRTPAMRISRARIGGSS